MIRPVRVTQRQFGKVIEVPEGDEVISIAVGAMGGAGGVPRQIFLSALQHWYRQVSIPASGAVSSWTDSSSGSNVATTVSASKPVVDSSLGKRGIRFTAASQQQMTAPALDVYRNGWTLAIVAAVATTAGANFPGFLDLSFVGGGTNRCALLFQSGGGPPCAINLRSVAAGGNQTTATNSTIVGLSSIVRLIGSLEANGNLHLYVNGVEVAGSPLAGVTFPQGFVNVLSVGALNGFATGFLDGWLFEAITASRGANAAEVARLDAYLATV